MNYENFINIYKKVK